MADPIRFCDRPRFLTLERHGNRNPLVRVRSRRFGGSAHPERCLGSFGSRASAQWLRLAMLSGGPRRMKMA